MMSFALKVEGLGKKYSITTSNKSDTRVASYDFFQFLSRRKKYQSDYESKNEFWALRDVSFSVEPGTRLGVIGKNGAGKSTLLKILSRITEPTEGRVLVNGKMASLLEVGTGFHPELSGRENVFLNGSILGLSSSAIKSKFEAIVAFSGVEKFIDMPVKHYSSGMQVRLAFAVAAHLEPEILILDEVLAVGDAAFQAKCMQKMNEISSSGTTVIFVSHGMGAIRQYCNQALLLDGGHVRLNTPNVDDAINLYLDRKEKSMVSVWERKNNVFDSEWYRPESLRLVDAEGRVIAGIVNRHDEVYIEICGCILIPEDDLTIGYALFDENDNEIYWSYPTDDSKNIGKHSGRGDRVFAAKIPTEILNSGVYTLKLIGGLHNRAWLYHPHQPSPQVDMEIGGGFSNSPFWNSKRSGILAVNSKWRVF